MYTFNGFYTMKNKVLLYFQTKKMKEKVMPCFSLSSVMPEHLSVMRIWQRKKQFNVDTISEKKSKIQLLT